MSHTPGPWTFNSRPVMGAVDGCEIQTVALTAHTPKLTGPTFIGTCYTQANARLIAAAPTMFHELEQAADTFRDFSNVLRAIGKDVMSAAADVAERHIREQLAAIAKAEGRS